MGTLFLIVAFVLGTIVGSFLNVVILRYGNKTAVTGRSHCPVCGENLHWYELVPLVSFIVLGGRCHSCKSRISAQYPLVEAGTGLLFLLSWQKATVIAPPMFTADLLPSLQSLEYFAFFAVIWSLLMIILAYDLRHKIIPDAMVYTFAIVGLLGLILWQGNALFSFPGILDLAAGPLFFLPFYILWLVSKGRWIGLGDGKLALGMGWLLGFIGGLSAIVLGFWSGAVVSLAWMAIARARKAANKPTWETEIPFAPFLIFGTLCVFLWHIDVFHLSLLFSA